LQRGLVESQKHQNQVSLASKGPMRGRHYDIYLISIQEDFRWR
jgi:dTDP-4-dehydrorhamnose 3,5-epimerase-like enzyme